MRGIWIELTLFFACGIVTVSSASPPKDEVNTVAERYARLVLALGQHDPDYVDAFYGPSMWKTQAEKEKKSLDVIGAGTAELSATLTKTPDSATEFLEISFYCFSNSSTHPGA